jgi:transcriptional regulator with XRE-family HTH domain
MQQQQQQQQPADSIGTEIRRARSALGLTLHEFAGRAQLPWQTLAAYETGRTMPPADRLLRIAFAAGKRFRFARLAETVAKAA